MSLLEKYDGYIYDVHMIAYYAVNLMEIGVLIDSILYTKQ